MLNKPNFERSTIGNIRLHVMPTDRFKTYAISVYIGSPLAESSVTPTAMVPMVLMRGTQTMPETKQFRQRLDDLYGAGFGFDVYKRGDYQIVQFRMDMIEDRFVGAPASLLQQALHFVGETIARPAMQDGVFVPKYVDAEKQTLKKKIEAIINDKIRYAAERCLEEMCSNEPYRLRPLGNIADLQAIDPTNLYDHYRSWLLQSPIDLYVVGNTTLQEVEEQVAGAFEVNSNSPFEYQKTNQEVAIGEVKTVVDRLDVIQGKLNMGLRTAVSYADDLYPALLMYNGIFGGYPHSKLFVNVREKESLAYYASSRLDGHKGILTIQSGIEFANYEKAVHIIKQQLAAMIEGDISALELQQTKAMIANQLREIEDSAFEMISFDFNGVLSGKRRTVSELIAAIESMDVTTIRKAAEQVSLDTIYFLRDREGV